MVMKIKPWKTPWSGQAAAGATAKVIYLSPQGRKLTQQAVKGLANRNH
jgi:tRNA (guanine37-N1)-methyltransferase